MKKLMVIVFLLAGFAFLIEAFDRAPVARTQSNVEWVIQDQIDTVARAIGVEIEPDGEILYVTGTYGEVEKMAVDNYIRLAYTSLPVAAPGDSGSMPTLTPDGNILIVGDEHGDLFFLDPSTLATLNTIDHNFSSGPYNRIIVSDDATQAFAAVPGYLSGKIYFYNLQTETPTLDQTLIVPGNPFRLALSPDNSLLFVAIHYNGAGITHLIHVIDVASRQIIKSINTSVPVGNDIAIDADSNVAYFSGLEGIAVIDLATLSQVSAWPVPAQLRGGMAFEPLSNLVVVATNDGRLLFMDAADGGTITFELPIPGVGPGHPAFAPDGQTLYLPDHASGSLLVIAPANQPPTANAGGPYIADEGTSFVIDGTSSFDPDDGQTLSFEWDLDYDGSTFNVDTVGVTTTVQFADNLPERTIALRVTDSLGASDLATTSLSVRNVPPTIQQIAVPLDPVPLENQAEATIDITFDDPAGAADEFYMCAFDIDYDGVTFNPDIVDASVIGNACAAPVAYAAPGVYTIRAVVTDKDGGSDTATATDLLVVYDNDGGFVTGGGWIWSELAACAYDDLCSGAEGKANFGFVSKYRRGAMVPTGSTEFNFSAGGFNFHSTSYDWLVVNQGGSNAMFQGVGTVNGDFAPNGEPYRFKLWATDSSSADDTFRIKIWYEDGGELPVYDNGFDQPIGGGNIKVHTGN